MEDFLVFIALIVALVVILTLEFLIWDLSSRTFLKLRAQRRRLNEMCLHIERKRRRG